MQQRETTAERLADIIDIIKFGHRTGQLTVERGEHVTFEEGMIMFVAGQITQAVVGNLKGVEALNWLNTWGACRFHFTSPSSDNMPSPSSLQANGISPMSTPAQNLDGARKREQAQAPVPQAGIPYRIKQGDSILQYLESLGLSRTHRRLFLLIDGRRAPVELARLMNYNLGEVQNMLKDLERAGIIHL